MFCGLIVDSTQSTSGARGSVFEVEKNLQGNSEFTEPLISDLGERKFSSSSSGFPYVHGPPIQTSGSSEFSFDARSSTGHIPMHSATNDASSRRSRPSFLDSLNVSRASSASPFQHNQSTKDAFPSHSSQLNSINAIGSSPFEKPSTESENMGTFSKLRSPDFPSASEYSGQFTVPASNNGDALGLNVANENILDKKHEFYSTKQNEDFAALEQVVIFFTYLII